MKQYYGYFLGTNFLQLQAFLCKNVLSIVPTPRNHPKEL